VSAPVASPSRGDRLRDVLALVLVVGGIGLVLLSNSGMHRLATQPIVVAHGEWAMAQYEHYRRLGMLGYIVALAGIATGIWSYLHLARARQASAEAGAEAGAGPTAQV
jgi:hypothetical protein